MMRKFLLFLLIVSSFRAFGAEAIVDFSRPHQRITGFGGSGGTIPRPTFAS